MAYNKLKVKWFYENSPLIVNTPEDALRFSNFVDELQNKLTNERDAFVHFIFDTSLSSRIEISRHLGKLCLSNMDWVDKNIRSTVEALKVNALSLEEETIDLTIDYIEKVQRFTKAQSDFVTNVLEVIVRE